jgi:FixJ family two-component response regulator
VPNRRHLLLLVDEDAAIRDALHFVLRIEGFKVLTYAAGAALLAASDLPRASCLILDERGTGIDGFTVLSELRARAHLTTHRTPHLITRAQQAGVHTVLEKPLFDDVLLQHILLILAPANTGDDST